MLVLLPSSTSKLVAKWQGPFVVTRQVGDVDYEVVRSDQGGATQIYHLNLLKACRERCFADVFSPLPGRTSLIHHHTETPLGVTVRSRPYRLPEHKRKKG